MVTMPTRLPESCATLPNLLLSPLSSLSDFFAPLVLLALLADFDGPALLAPLAFAVLASGFWPPLGLPAPGGGTINAITFCRTMAMTGQFTESSRLLGSTARSAAAL